MIVEASFSRPEEIRASSLVFFCHKDAYPRDINIRKIDNRTDGLIKQVFESEEFNGHLNQSVLFHKPAGFLADRIIIAGIGSKKKLNDNVFRRVAGTVSRLLAVRKSNSVAFFLFSDMDKNIAASIVEGFILGGFTITKYKSDDNSNGSLAESLCLYTDNIKRLSGIEKVVMRAHIIAEGATLARRLSGDPSNSLTPREFVARAKNLAAESGFICEALDERKIKKERMGGLLAVAQGSDQPPRFAILKYNGTNSKARPIVLVGKGITFDSGGISLKPALYMQDMKQDMTGAGNVLAVITTAAKLGIKRNIIGLIPLAENMPSGKAYRPGDILSMRNGKTVEIINTDAEGRLILADALDFADSFNPQAVIDIATLTGAAKYILGSHGALIMGNNKRLIAAMLEASDRTAERVLELPILDPLREAMKSDIADLKNSGGPKAGSIKAAAFLEYFVGADAWVHFDIASVDLALKSADYIPKGPTGFGFRLLVDLISNWKKL